MTPRGLDIVCVGFAEWDTELWTNQHHLMARLAPHNRVLFVESLGLRRPTASGRDLRRIARRLVTGLRPPRRVASPHGGEVRVVSPLVLPFHGSAAVRRINGVVLPALVRRAMRRAFTGSRGRRVLWAYVPQADLLLDAVEPDIVLYHCVDDIAAQDGVDAPSFRAAEARILDRADLVLASAPSLAERLRPHTRRLLFAPNVADTALFATARDDGPEDPALAHLPHPRIVFTGAIAAKKLDLELLTGLAHARPDWSIVLVGPVGLGDTSTDVRDLEALPNVHLPGPRTYAGLPAVLRAADAALIPYRRSPLTDAVFPMKVYEYLAAGLPVVATPLPSISAVREITVAADARATVEALEEVLARDDEQRRDARSAAAAAHSWDARLEEITAALEEITDAHQEAS